VSRCWGLLAPSSIYAPVITCTRCLMLRHRRIDFRDLVSDLFSQFKTRIWMQQVDRLSIPGDTDPGNILAQQAGFLHHPLPSLPPMPRDDLPMALGAFAGNNRGGVPSHGGDAFPSSITFPGLGGLYSDQSMTTGSNQYGYSTRAGSNFDDDDLSDLLGTLGGARQSLGGLPSSSSSSLSASDMGSWSPFGLHR
jgi:PSP1 C-terminal conserved region